MIKFHWSDQHSQLYMRKSRLSEQKPIFKMGKKESSRLDPKNKMQFLSLSKVL